VIKNISKSSTTGTPWNLSKDYYSYQHYSEHRLRTVDFESADLLGDAYEYLIKQFADSAGMKVRGGGWGGEFCAASDVVWLLVSLLKPMLGKKIYDPTADLGGRLMQTRNYDIAKGENAQNLSLYGQEMNLNT
jgi:type I restriction enzyme M protein